MGVVTVTDRAANLGSKGGWAMRREGEVQAAWFFWNLLFEVSDLLFDRYQDEFMDLIMEENEERHRHLEVEGGRQAEEIPLLPRQCGESSEEVR
jgi:hypothetical protein